MTNTETDVDVMDDDVLDEFVTVVGNVYDARLSAARHLLEICAPDGTNAEKLRDAVGWLRAAHNCAKHFGTNR